MTNPEETMEERFLKKWEQVFFYDRDTLGHPYLKCTEKVLAFIRSELLLQHEKDRQKIKTLKIWSAEEAMDNRVAPEMFLSRNDVLDALKKMKGEA